MSLLLTFMELDKLYENYSALQNIGKWYFKGVATVPPNRPHANKIFKINDFITVTGKSEADALNNVKFKIRKDNNLPVNTRLILSDYTIFERSEVESKRKICTRCEKAALTDGGICPICDDGEEDY